MKILLVEDQEPVAIVIGAALSRSRYGSFTTTVAATLAEATAQLQVQSFDLILLDLNLPDSQGLDTLKKVRILTPQTPVVVLSGLSEDEVVLASLGEGVQDYLIKGQFTNDEMCQRVRNAYYRYSSDSLTRTIQEMAAEIARLTEEVRQLRVASGGTSDARP